MLNQHLNNNKLKKILFTKIDDDIAKIEKLYWDPLENDREVIREVGIYELLLYLRFSWFIRKCG